MSTVLVEGWDHIADASLKGWSANVSSLQSGRLGGNCARLSAPSGGTKSITKTLSSALSTLTFGFAYRWQTANAAQREICILRVSTTQTVRLQLDFNGTNKLRVLNSGGTVVATGSVAIVANNWYYIEIKVVINGASGTVEVHVNNATDIAQTTGNFGSSNIDNILIQSTGTTLNQTADFDDMYVNDAGTFFGDSRVETVFPTANGANTDFTPSTGTDHAALVDETSPNDDTDYVESSTNGHVDTYNFTDLSSGAGGIKAVATNVYAKKTDAGARSMASVVRQGGSNNAGTTKALTTSYAHYQQIYDQDPASADWTPSSVNAAEFGHKVAA